MHYIMLFISVWPHQPHQWAWNDSDKHNILTCSTNNRYRYTSTWVDKVYVTCIRIDDPVCWTDSLKGTRSRQSPRTPSAVCEIWLICESAVILSTVHAAICSIDTLISQKQTPVTSWKIKTRLKEDSNVRLSGLSLSGLDHLPTTRWGFCQEICFLTWIRCWNCE